jgi:hypothetical protein
VSTAPQRARSHLGGLVRKGAPPEQVAEARRALKYARASAFLCELVESAPPFTPEQRLRLTAILCNPAGGSNGAA